ncbi:hypothetical protein [Nostoc sp. DedQUE07]|uniref:hypothetical protein n=1 Tax=Nostoc sp. DedQUE07 TaxID=3075392 RepID=UPI002AD2FEC7|nr:hypothetical protein [Nostoc sp. DedQUE07]MDZ8131851.1 hypothetical protein [Nostoc sp. DedQUE07]
MTFNLEASQQREQQLVKLLSKEANPTIQERNSLQKELDSLRENIANNMTFQSLQVGHYVVKANRSNLGKITEKSPLSHPTVFVSWSGGTPVSEQPRLLQLDEIANSGIVKAGDIVRVANKENGKITGYRLEKVVDLQAHGYIEIANNEVVSFAHGHWQIVEEFDRWDFDWIVGESYSDTNEKDIINAKASLARASLSTATLALEWVNQYLKGGDRGRIEALEKRIRQLSNPSVSLSPLEYLRELKVIVHPPIAARIVNAAAVDKLLHIAVAAVTAEELEVAECLIADAEKFATSAGLVLKVNMDGWLIAPLCKTTEEALALCPERGDRVMVTGENGSSRLGSIVSRTSEVGSAGVQVKATVKWDDGVELVENAFTLEALPPLLEYLSSIENAQTDDNHAQTKTEEIKKAPLPLGVQEVLVSKLRSHPINSTIYGEVEDDTTLDEMIQSSGWIKTLLVTPEGDVVGGNRRLRIARKQGKEKVLVEVREFASDAAVLEALLLDNAVREKTVEQKVREARLWLPIESEKAKLRKGRSENQENFPGGEAGQVRDIVAARVGLGSGKSLQKAEKVLAAIEALKEVDAVASEGLRDLLNNKSIHAAYCLVCQSEERLKWQPKVGERVSVSLKADRHAGANGTIAEALKGTFALVRFDSASEEMSEDMVSLSLLLPADIADRKSKQKADREQKKPETRFGLTEQPGGGLLPEAPRNEGFDPNATPSDGDGKQNTPISNVINLPLRVDSETTGDTSVAMEIAMGIRHLTPKELAESVNWAAEDNTKPLTDAHLDALMAVIRNIWERRHPEVAN